MNRLAPVIFAVLIGFAAGWLAQSRVAKQRERHNIAFFTGQLAKQELMELERRAAHAYFTEAPEIAAWANEELLNAYARAELRGPVSADAGENDNTGGILFAHLRLARLYRYLGREDDRRRHLDLALAARPEDNESGLLALLDAVDARQRKELGL